MPYCLDRWDHICPNGHRNTIDKTYLATEPSDSAVAFAISFPDKLPCAGCRYKLTLLTLDSVLHCNISEFEYERIKENKLAESAAYHETSHSVIAAVQKLRLDRRGLRIDQRGSGISYFKFAKPEGKVNLGSEVEREQTFDQRSGIYRSGKILGLIVLTPRAADSLSNQKCFSVSRFRQY